MTRSVHFDETELFSQVLRERADGTSLVVWLPLELEESHRDWERILTISRDSIPVGMMHVIPAAIDTVREQVASGWLSAILGRRRRRDEDDDPVFIPNGSTGTQIAKRRRDAVLVVTTDDTEVTDESLRGHWPVAERFKQLGQNLWLVVGVVSPDGTA